MGPKDSKECKITISFADNVIGTLDVIDFTFVKVNEQELKDKEIRDAKNDQNR